MGLLDKVKGQAQELKGKVEERVEDVQAKRRSAELLEDLGRLVYAERTGRPRADAGTETDRIVDELTKLQADGTEVLPSDWAA